MGPLISTAERLEAIKGLPLDLAEEYFFSLNASDQSQLVFALPPEERRMWVRMLAPDDAADLIQAAPNLPARDSLLALIDEATRREVQALLAYQEDHAGGLMSPRFGRLRPEMTAQEAISYLRQQSLLPFILRSLKFDPASAPFVATLVDVTGLIIYFTTASIVMRGTLL